MPLKTRFNAGSSTCVCLALAVGFVTGRLTVERRSSDVPGSRTDEGASGVSQPLLLAKIGKPLQIPVSTSETSRPDADAADGANELKALSRIAGQLTTSVQVQLFSRFDRLHPDAMAILGLDARQAASLDSALESARSQMDALSSRNAQVEMSGDGISVRVPALEGGPGIYDDLMDAFTNVLGKEKSEALVTLLGDQFSAAFSHFGAEERSITIARTLPGYATFNDDGYYLKEVRTMSNGRSDTSSWRFWPGRMEYVPAKIQWATRLVADRLEKTYPPKVPE